MNDLIWKTFLIFILCFLFIWVILYTYNPEFLLSNDDYSDKGKNIQNKDDSLSARGRTIIFLSALIIALVVCYIFYMIARKYHKT